MLLPNPSSPSLLLMDLHLSFGQLVSGTHRALLGSPPSKGSLQVPPTKGSVQGSPLPSPAIVMLKSPGHVSVKN